MTGDAVYRALDTTFALRVEGRLARVVVDAHSDLLTDGTMPAEHEIALTRRFRDTWNVTVDGSTHARRCNPSTAVHTVRRAISDLALQSVSATHTVIGASAVQVGDAVVGMFGNIVSGKSTLAVAAARRGHRLLADDVLAIDANGTARPFHRPIALRPVEARRLGIEVPDGPFDHGWPVKMSSIGALAPGAPLTLLLELRRDHEATTIHALPPSTALMHLSSQALRAPGRHRAMFQRLAALVRDVPAGELYHHDPERAVDLIERAVEAGPTA